MYPVCFPCGLLHDSFSQLFDYNGLVRDYMVLSIGPLCCRLHLPAPSLALAMKIPMMKEMCSDPYKTSSLTFQQTCTIVHVPCGASRYLKVQCMCTIVHVPCGASRFNRRLEFDVFPYKSDMPGLNNPYLYYM